MAMLMYMPWCRIDHDYNVGEIVILPFERRATINGVDTGAWSRLCAILGTRRDINGNPVDRAALIQFAGKGLTDDQSDDQLDVAGDLVMLACFAGLASREYFMPYARYCNSDCFTFCAQKFNHADVTAISTRRRDGRSFSVWPLDRVSVSVPAHCERIKEISLDNMLLDALLSQRTSASDQEWGRWQNSITCFNLANTDNATFREHIEWVLLCSAFEHLLDAKSNATDVARLFDEAFVPSDVLPATNAARFTGHQMSSGNSVRYEWMREFYRVRGDFAHGKLLSQQPMVWNAYEHLLLATVAFPFVAKCLLSKAGKYQLTNDDNAQIDCFESLADTPDFFTPPVDADSSWGSKWARLVDSRRSAMRR